MKRIGIALIIATGLASIGEAGQRKYELGTCYTYYSWTPRTQIVRDLETMAAAGINAVHLYPPFLLTPGDPRPDFSKADLAMDTAARLGLRVMPNTFWIDMVPYLAAAKWPGREPSPTVDIPARNTKLSLADPEVLALVDSYMTLTVRHFKDHPALVAWNIWDEASFRPSSPDPHAQRWFEEWGRKKYGSTAAWFAQWNDVQYNHEYHKINRTLFQWDATARLARHFAALTKAIDPAHPTRTHNVGSTIVNDHPREDDWALARSVDQYGLSFYPDVLLRPFEAQPEALEKAAALWDTPWTASLILATSHDSCVCKPFGVFEAQTGPQTGMTRSGHEPGAVYDYGKIHLLAWQMVAHDAKSVYFWMWLPHLDEWQAFGRGLAASDGSLTPRAVAAGDAAKAIAADAPLFLDSHPVAPQSAVVYDVLGDLKAKFRGDDWGGYTMRNLLGIHRALWKEQFRVAFLDARQLTAAGLAPYKLVIFPFAPCLRSTVATAIEKYVAGGGTVLADARFGIINELHRGYAVNPGLGMARLFGARRHDLVASHVPAEIRITHRGALVGAELPPRLAGGDFRGLHPGERRGGGALPRPGRRTACLSAQLGIPPRGDQGRAALARRDGAGGKGLRFRPRGDAVLRRMGHHDAHVARGSVSSPRHRFRGRHGRDRGRVGRIGVHLRDRRGGRSRLVYADLPRRRTAALGCLAGRAALHSSGGNDSVSGKLIESSSSATSPETPAYKKENLSCCRNRSEH
jgi:hypothetical protein